MKKFLIIFLGFICALLALFLFKVHDFYTTVRTDTNHPLPTVPPEKKVFNILALGYGGVNHEGAYLTDTMMVIHVDLQKNKAVLISLPRDIWVEVPTKDGSTHAKINSVYEMGLFKDDYPGIEDKYHGEQGAAELTKKVVGDLTGLPIDYYVGVDFGGFVKLIDTVGGVDVNVEKTFDDYVYPVEGKETDTCGKQDQELQDALNQATQEAELAFPCRYEHIHLDKGVQHMDGKTALKYARSRHSLQDGTDFGRAKRQQLVLEAAKEKMLSVTVLPKVLPLMDEAKNYLRMDLSADLLQKFLLEAKQDSKRYTIVNLVPSLDNYLENGTGPSGEYILKSSQGDDEWSDMKKWISDTIEGITPTPTPGPTNTPGPSKKPASLSPTTSK
jgi:anionic cell wall polymer biosynthesis LytR-Cps2A-Psr (LCP) family protein